MATAHHVPPAPQPQLYRFSPLDFATLATYGVRVASVLLILLAPVMLATAIAIKLTSPGPILFRQARLGFNNQQFEIYKFR